MLPAVMPLVIVLAVRVAAGTAGFRVGPSLNKNPAKEFSYRDRLVCLSVVQYEMARWTSQHEQHDSELFNRQGNNGRRYGVYCAATDESVQRRARY
jgi:hypothetical protein